MKWLESVRVLAAIRGWIVIGMFFLGQAAGYVPNPLEARIISHEINMQLSQDRMVIAIRVICENMAKSSAELNNCRNIR